jgi:hypothetical protein
MGGTAMLNSSTFTRRLKIAGVSAMASAMALGGGAIAQDATPDVSSEAPSEGFQVMIHEGSCSDLSSEAAFEIGQAVTFGTTDGNEPDTIGAEGGVTTVLLGVSSDVDADLQTLGGDGHAVVVHASPEDDTVVACGNIAGAVNDGELAMAIAPVGETDVVGVALLEEDGDGTHVKVYLFNSDVEEKASATPVA